MMLRKTALVLLGGILGVAIVRLFFFDIIEEAAWILFWQAVGWAWVAFKEAWEWLGSWILGSATFAKCLIGFAAGGFAGCLAAEYLERRTARRWLRDGRADI